MPSITFSIAAEDYDEFKEAFLLCQMVPVDDATGDPIMTDNQWIKEWGRRQYHDAYRLGRRIVRDRANPMTQDPDIMA